MLRCLLCLKLETCSQPILHTYLNGKIYVVWNAAIEALLDHLLKLSLPRRRVEISSLGCNDVDYVQLYGELDKYVMQDLFLALYEVAGRFRLQG